MGKLVLLRANTGYEGPPPSLVARDPELAEYLWVLHNALFGGPQNDANPDIDTSTLEVDHSLARNLDADGHPQYLTHERHAAIGANPHGVTAAEVGNDQPLWNAAALMGNDVAPDAPAAGQVLTWDAELEAWGPATPTEAPTGTYLEIETAAYSITAIAGNGFSLPLLPTNAVIFAVIAKNLTAMPGTGYQIGTTTRRDAWGACGALLGEESRIGGYAIAGPLYSKETLASLVVFFTPQGGAFVGTETIGLRVLFWRVPAGPFA